MLAGAGMTRTVTPARTVSGASNQVRKVPSCARAAPASTSTGMSVNLCIAVVYGLRRRAPSAASASNPIAPGAGMTWMVSEVENRAIPASVV